MQWAFPFQQWFVDIFGKSIKKEALFLLSMDTMKIYIMM